MVVREATIDDVGAVQRVARSSWHAGYDDVLGPDVVDKLLAERYDLASLEALVERERTPVLVSETDEVVGFVQAEPSGDGPIDAGVRKLYVDPDHWGDGHGSALLDEVLDVLRADGHGDVWVAVLADNELARSFYDKHGFDLYMERTIELAGQEFDDVLLTREL